ncbi:MAG: VPLPA-CTERM-specific exosortase XrtD [Blastocatellia bacterium]
MMPIERKTLWPISLIVLAWLAVYYDVLRRLVSDWWVDENYSHGFLIPIICGYAIWSQRERLLALPVASRWWTGAALMALAALTLFAGVMGAELYITRLSLVLSLVALTVYFGGFVWLRALIFPLGLLLFALPIPNIVFNQIAFPLQLIASDFATRAIKLFGIPALREGNVIELAQMKLQVVEACSGIRSLVTLATLAVVYAYFAETRWWRRIALVVAVIPIAVIANAARVAGTGVLAHHQGVQVAEGFLHSFSGLAVFLVAVVLLFFVAKALNLFGARTPAGARTGTSAWSADVPVRPSPGIRPLQFYVALIFLFLTASVTYFLAQSANREQAPQRTTFAEFPAQFDSWRQVEVQTLDTRTERELAADDYLSRTYFNQQAYAYLFIAFHNSQRHRQTFHSPQNCIPGAGWTLGNYRRHTLGVGEANEYLIEKDGAQMLALYWYQGRGKIIASEYLARLDTIKDAMWLGRTDGSLIRVIVPIGKGDGAEEFARKSALEFSQKLLPALPAYIPN